MPGIRKLYHSIREVSEATGLRPHVLRYWETEFEALRPKKNRAGNRVYTQRDIEIVERIQGLLRDEKYTIEGARAVLARNEPGPAVESVAGAADPPARATSRGALGPEMRAELVRLRAFLSDVAQGLG